MTEKPMANQNELDSSARWIGVFTRLFHVNYISKEVQVQVVVAE
jgi:hypothetical protein